MGHDRPPGTWRVMLKDMERSAGLRFLTGMFCLVLGAAIYLVTPWRPGDWLAVAVSAIGGLCAAEGLLILAAGDRFLALARRLMHAANAFWAGFAAVFGLAVMGFALARL